LIETLAAPARAMEVPISELAAIVERGKEVEYDAGACLFHESTPREWLGIIMDGQVEIVPGLHRRQTHLATLTHAPLPSHRALRAEGILPDARAHSSSAFARGGKVRVHQVSRDVLDEVKSKKPEIFYRIVARVAQRIGDRLREASALLAEQSARAPEISSYR